MTDREIYIAEAPKRVSTKWKNKKTTWSALRERCSKTRWTNETLAEYKALPKAQQSEIKDVGGFVGGFLEDGKRAKGQVEFRDVLTLDIDYGVSGMWDGFTLAYDCAAFAYSTHNHTASKPRIRLVILLARSINPEEYEAVGRAVAASVGIDLFDDTTYEPERLMYWPSTSKGGDWFFESQDGAALDPDAILATYHNWQDASEWPYSRRVVETVRREATKQGDPLSKPGIVGAFCREYNIHEAIAEFLPDVYTSAGDNRYTYCKGSVASGLVLYQDGAFAYSHNNTDPCSQHLVNAFDLVRMHLYGDLDEDVDTKVSINKRPSYLRMAELCASNSRVKSNLLAERMKTAVHDFSLEDVPEADNAEEDAKWSEGLDVTGKGQVKNTMRNAAYIIENHPAFKGKLWHDDFTGFDRYNGSLPWNKLNADGAAWSNVDFACLRKFLEVYGITGKDKIRDAFLSVTNKNRRHPVAAYLRSLTWDGSPRLEKLFIDFLGADDTPLVRTQTKKQFVGAVARILDPGCKMDTFMVLSGKEGIGKSTILNKLAGAWFNDSLTTFEGKEAMEALRGSWIIEVAELASMKRSEVESVKAYVSKRIDKFRPAYAEVREEVPRECVFFGTTNETNFLKGFTGNRRFWVIETGINQPSMSVFNDLTEDYRGQIWAEAVELFDAGETVFLDAEMEAEARKKQLEYNELTGDERVGIIQRYLDTPLPADWDTYSIERRKSYIKGQDPLSPDGIMQRNIVSAVEIFVECFGGVVDEKSRYKMREINALVRQVEGWSEGGRRRLNGYGLQRVYVRDNQVTNNNEEEL